MKTRELILWLCIGALTVASGIHSYKVERLRTATQDTSLVCEDRDWRLRAEVRELKLQVAELAKFVGKQHPEAVDARIWHLEHFPFEREHGAISNVVIGKDVNYLSADKCPMRDAGADAAAK